MAEKKRVKKRPKKRISVGVIAVCASFNNTRVTVTDLSGNVLCSVSAGQLGYKNARKGTPYVGQLVGEKAAKDALEFFDMKKVSLRVRGAGSGRDSAVRAIGASGLSVSKIEDITPLPHNGCRAPKKRRV